jgi:beta-glucanase (GH16 family)
MNARHWQAVTAALTWMAACTMCPGDASSVDTTRWQLTWQDEFTGAAIDTSKWKFDLGNGPPAGWGNNELEYYTSRTQNAFVQSDVLHIKAIKESYSGYNYTSARMKTKDLFSQTYGRYEFSAKLPLGQGLWPAVWMMPQDSAYGGWAASGEIDILEAKGQNSSVVQGTIFYGGAWPNQKSSTKTYTLPGGGSIADFHEYVLEWEPTEIRWYVDGYLYETQNSWYTTGYPYPAPFDKPFYVIMNLAVGGNYVGSPNSSTPFPSEMQVDYIRVYTAVPEPGTLVLLGASAVGLLLVARRLSGVPSTSPA